MMNDDKYLYDQLLFKEFIIYSDRFKFVELSRTFGHINPQVNRRCHYFVLEFQTGWDLDFLMPLGKSIERNLTFEVGESLADAGSRTQ